MAAPIRTFTGFEVGVSTAGVGVTSGPIVLDGTARTGCYYHRTDLGTIAGRDNGQLLIPGSSITLSGVEVAYGSCRGYVRLTAAVDLPVTLFSLGGGTITTQAVQLQLNPDNSLTLRVSSATAVVSAPLSLNTWHKLELTMQFPRDYLSPGKGLVVGAAQIDGGGWSASLEGGGAGFEGFSGFRSVGWGALDAFSSTTVGTAEWDDITLVWSKNPAEAVLPAADRVRLVPVVGQVTAEWVGDFSTVQDVPPTILDVAQTSNVAGQVTIFRHQTAAQLGMAAVQALKTYAYCIRSVASSVEAIRVGSTDYPVNITATTGSSPPEAIVWAPDLAAPMTTPWTPAEFDGITYGMVNVTTNAAPFLRLRSFLAEALYTPDAANWFVCQGTSVPGSGGLSGDGSAPPFAQVPTAPGEGCLVTFPPGSDSGGGSGCSAGVAGGSDSGGGSGCGVTL